MLERQNGHARCVEGRGGVFCNVVCTVHEPRRLLSFTVPYTEYIMWCLAIALEWIRIAETTCKLVIIKVKYLECE